MALLTQLERQSHSNQVLARYLASAFAEGKPTDWFGSLPAAIAAVTPADVHRVARLYLRPRQLEIGIAGPATLTRELESLGELELYSVKRSTDSASGD